jgi:hypothetical protein
VNEMTSLRELGETLDQDLRGPSLALRRTVLADIGEPPGSTRSGRSRDRSDRTRGRRGPTRVRWGRLGLVGGLVVVLVAALFATSTLLWGPSPGASAQAADVLRQAAEAARDEPVLTAGPSQFIYIKFAETAAEMEGSSKIIGMPTSLYENWLSASGTRAGLERSWASDPSDPARATGAEQNTVLQGCRDGRTVGGSQGMYELTPGGKKYPVRCAPVPAYPRGVPTSASGMRAYLYRTSQGQNPPDVQAFITAGDLIRDSYLRPAALAALFEAVIEIPGVSLVQHAVNVVGQPGIAVQQTFNGISQQLIFDPQTYAFIGEREIVVGASSGLPVGKVIDSTALLGLGVASQVGQKPATVWAPR